MPDLALLMPTFDDGFDSFTSSPDGSRGWKTTLPHNLRTLGGNNEQQYYGDPSVGSNPFSLHDGELDITASAQANPAGLPYVSGIITTEKSFAQLYGYFQMTAELPAGTGMWPAFWLLPANLSGTNEIDVMEMFGRAPTTYYATDHSPGSGIAQAQIAVPDLTQGFHSYGVYWTPASLSFYFDGNLVANMPTPPDMNSKMFMLANLAVSGDVSTATAFPAELKIDEISAYAYDPSVPGPTPQLHVILPGAANGNVRQAIPLRGVQVSDSDTDATGNIQVVVSDKSLGLLSTAPTAGVAVMGENGWRLQLSGSLQAVNAALSTLTYENVPAGGTAPVADTITVAAVDSENNLDAQRIQVALGPAPQMQFIAVAPSATRYMASGNDAFVLQHGQIVDPAANQGQAAHIINFHGGDDGGAAGDFLALHGFDQNATLVFDHYAAPDGVTDKSFQYYRVADPSGGSPIFLVQMADGATAPLTARDFGFYPT